MMTVDLRELADRVADYVARVRSGETIVVTEHDEPVAVLSPVEGNETGLTTTELARIREMEAQGLLRWNGGKPTGLPPGKAIKMRGDKTMSDIVLEDRGER